MVEAPENPNQQRGRRRGGERPRTPGIGQLEGRDVEIQQNGIAHVYDDPDNPRRYSVIGHGDDIQPNPPDGPWYKYDKNTRTFYDVSDLPNVARKGPTGELKERLKTLTPVGKTPDGSRFWVEEGIALIDVSSEQDLSSIARLPDGGTYKITDEDTNTEETWYFDLSKKKFSYENPVKEQVIRKPEGPPEVPQGGTAFTDAAEQARVQGALTARLAGLQQQGIDTTGLPERIAQVTSQEAAQFMREELDLFATLDDPLKPRAR